MYFVLRTTLGGPPEYQEYCYTEVVTVRDGVVITQLSETATQLQVTAGFVLLGTVETEAETEQLIRPTPPPAVPSPAKLPPVSTAAKTIKKSVRNAPAPVPPRAHFAPYVPWFGPEGVNLKPRQG